MCFSSGDSDVKDNPHSRWSHAAVTPRNEEHLNQHIHAKWKIMTRELCMELDIGFSALEMMVAMLEYHKVCTRWVSQIHRNRNASLSGPIELIKG